MNRSDVATVRRRRLAGRFLTLVILGFLLSKIAPTLAEEVGIIPAGDQINSSPSPTNADPSIGPITLPPATSDTALNQNEPIANTTASPTIPSEPMPTPSPSATPTVLPDSQQVFQLAVPASLPVDPRARTLFLPKLIIQGSGNILVCATTLGSNLDVFNLNMVDSKIEGQKMVQGDMSPQLLVTGSVGQVNALINGVNGMSIFNFGKSVSNDHIIFRVVGVSAPVLNESFCNAAKGSNIKIIDIQPLGVTLDMRKGDVVLKR